MTRNCFYKTWTYLMCLGFLFALPTRAFAETAIDTVDASKVFLTDTTTTHDPVNSRADTALQPSVKLSDPLPASPHPKLALTPEEMRHLRLKFGIGSGLFVLGFAMNISGSKLFTHSFQSENKGMIGLGFLTALSGIPVTGIGSNMMTHAVNALSQDSIVRAPGWGLYGASWTLMLLGGGMLALSTTGSDTDNGDNAKLALLGGGSALLGVIAHLMAWYEFTQDGLDAIKAYHSFHVSATPAFIPSSSGKLASGLQLSLAF